MILTVNIGNTHITIAGENTIPCSSAGGCIPARPQRWTNTP